MENRPSARQYYSSIRGEVFIFNAFKDSLIWSNISYDLSIVWLLIAALLYYIRRRVSYRAVKLEKLREIELDNKRAKDHIVSIRVFKAACVIFIFFVLFFIGFSQSYSLTYLRYLAEGGPQAVTIDGTINEEIEFDEKITEIPGSLDGIPGTFEEIELYLRIDKCPDVAAIYINGKEAEPPLEYYRNSGGLLKESYFTNIIRTTLDYKAEEINTLEVRAGNFDKVWTFIHKEKQGA